MAPKGNSHNMPGTPGRQGKASRTNQYFDVGKVGRKTGITLRDTGVRDEYGLEPVSGIFSSPEVPRSTPRRNGGGSVDREGSGSMDMQNSSAPSVNTTLRSRKTPHYPLPRSTPQRKSGIGRSPKRMSTGRASRYESEPLGDSAINVDIRRSSQQPANRKLEFQRAPANTVQNTLSPFRPKKTLRRSTGPIRPDQFELPEDSEAEEDGYEQTAQPQLEPSAFDDDDDSLPGDDGPLMLDDDPYDTPQQQLVDESARAEQSAHASSTRDDMRHSRTSGDSMVRHASQESPPSRKRDRSSLVDDLPDDNIQDEASPSRKRGRPSSTGTGIVFHENGVSEELAADQIAAGDMFEAPLGLADEIEEEANDMEGEQPGQDQEEEEDGQVEPEEMQPPEPQPKKAKPGRPRKGAGKEKTAKATKSTAKVNPSGSPVRLNGSPSKTRNVRGTSAGPVSNVNLRATTPFENAGQVSRFGRPVIAPLQYWRNENYIWKHGEVEGVIRAEEVEEVKRKAPKRGRKKASKTKKNGSVSVEEVDEDSESESIMPDEWEDQLGVISGTVATWDAETGTGDPDQVTKEDIAFSASSIVTRDVANANFMYAKILTIPFFGCGIVELPPEGFKRAKNSRRMQMVFFVHTGKVFVQVGGSFTGQGTGSEALGEEFAISRGGVWVVPRGNNYAITNESTTKTARVFFAQGCEVPAES